MSFWTYGIGVEVPKAFVLRILLSGSGDPYGFIRLKAAQPASSSEMLIVGGADCKVGHDGLSSTGTRRLKNGCASAIPWRGRFDIAGRAKSIQRRRVVEKST